MNILDELNWRGLVADCTDTAELMKKLTTPTTLSRLKHQFGDSQNGIKWTRGLRILTLTLVLAGCSPAPDAGKDTEIEGLRLQIAALEEKLKAKDQELLAILQPEKVAFEQIESEWLELGGVFYWTKEPPPSADDLSKLIQKYFDFQMKYESSPLVSNAKERIKLLNDGIERQAAIAQKERRFTATPSASLTDIEQYPEKYIGQSLRVSGSVRHRGSGYSIGSMPIHTTLNEQDRFLSNLTQGKPMGAYTTVIISIQRDAKLKIFGNLIEVR